MKWFNKLSRREKNIMKVAALVATLFIISQGVPGLRQYYSEGQRDISQLRDAIARETRLIEETDRWLSRQEELETIRPTMANLGFSGKGGRQRVRYQHHSEQAGRGGTGGRLVTCESGTFFLTD